MTSTYLPRAVVASAAAAYLLSPSTASAFSLTPLTRAEPAPVASLSVAPWAPPAPKITAPNVARAVRQDRATAVVPAARAIDSGVTGRVNCLRACRGTTRLRMRVRRDRSASAAARRRRLVLVGRSRFKFNPGAHTVRVRVGKHWRATLRRRRSSRLTLSIKLDDGGRSRTVRSQVRVRDRKHRRQARGAGLALKSTSDTFAICHFGASFVLTPALQLGDEPSTVEFATVEPAKIWCVGTINGHTVDPLTPGSYEERGRVEGTCSSGSGVGTATGRIPTTSGGTQTVKVDYDIAYIGLVGGETEPTFEAWGERRGPSITATFQFVPEDGDCVTAPLARFFLTQQQVFR